MDIIKLRKISEKMNEYRYADIVSEAKKKIIERALPFREKIIEEYSDLIGKYFATEVFGDWKFYGKIINIDIVSSISGYYDLNLKNTLVIYYKNKKDLLKEFRVDLQCYTDSVFNKRLIYGDSIEELKLYKEVKD